MKADKPSHLVPRLRFPEFRGDRPWSTPTFSDLYSFKRTNSLSRDRLNYDDGEIRNIHYGDIHTKFRPLFRLAEEHVPYINLDAWASGPNDDVFCEEGDIVFADASEDLEDVGKAIEVVSLEGERVVAGTHTILATRRRHVPVIGFSGQLFQSAAVRACIRREAQGSKVYGVSAGRVSGVPVPIPPTEEEQQKIADCLGSLDDLIATQGQKLEALRRHKKGLMQRLFSQPGETVPRLRFPEFRDSGAWKTRNLGDVVSRGNETFDPKTYSETPYLIELENVESNTGRILGVSEIKGHMSLKTRFQAGDVLYGKLRPYLRKFARPTFNGICTSEIWVLRSTVASSAFLFHFVQTERFAQLANVSSGSRMPRADWNFLANEDFGIPQPAEQQKIADCLDSLDDLIAEQNYRLETLQRHKKGLMQQLFPNLETK